MKNIMNESSLKKISIEKASEDLFDFAIDRSDIKLILQNLPEDIKINRVSMEYEIQLLKILAVGWSIPFFLDKSSLKKELSESFWNAVQSFSQSISTLSSSSTSKVDYFNTLKERLETYLNALNSITDGPDPLLAIGPKFAELCENKNNAHIMLAGSKVFNFSAGGVKSYLESIQIEPQ
ncbi:MAG: hypothetical protein SRB1_01741 [Desulfobacteraceae bacterium Eth-SRB1]|nr:MAG: hypothetical protein SRB1_01741 [Desulfobacteraceae bacterium Eth-SRB1]